MSEPLVRGATVIVGPICALSPLYSHVWSRSSLFEFGIEETIRFINSQVVVFLDDYHFEVGRTVFFRTSLFLIRPRESVGLGYIGVHAAVAIVCGSEYEVALFNFVQVERCRVCCQGV